MSLATPEDRVVVEALVQVAVLPDGRTFSRAYALLHRTLDADAEPGPVDGAIVLIRREDGGVVQLPHVNPLDVCGSDSDHATPGTCYGPVEGDLRPGERLELLVGLPDGGEITGVTTVPGAFEVNVPRELSHVCALPPGQTFELEWTPAEGAWAYIAETNIEGLAAVFEPLDIEVDDPLRLVGLALSAADTTIVFPSEFGVFDRATLEREVSLLLQEGLPEGSSADVTVAAVDRNYVNWARGGNFNPSGTVRVPSVTGDGTGFFGSAVRVDFGVVTDPGEEERPACAPTASTGGRPISPAPLNRPTRSTRPHRPAP